MRVSTISISGETLRVTELYELTLMNGITHYFTSHEADIIWGATPHTYTAIPIERGSIASQTNLEPSQVELTIANISGDLVDLLQLNILDGAQLVIKRLVYTDTYSAGKDIILFIGTCDIEFNRQVLKIICTSILDSLNLQVPKNVFQDSCNNQLFDSTCGLVKATYAVTGLVSTNGVSLSQIPCVGLTIPSDGYYTLGEVWVTSGQNAGQRRMIRSIADGVIYIVNPLPYLIAQNDAFTVYPGCDKTLATCLGRFLADNTDNYNGYLYIPKPEEAIL